MLDYLIPRISNETSKLWTVVKSSLEELVENNDIELLTPIEYVVGYICKNISSTNISCRQQPCQRISRLTRPRSDSDFNSQVNNFDNETDR